MIQWRVCAQAKGLAKLLELIVPIVPTVLSLLPIDVDSRNKTEILLFGWVWCCTYFSEISINTVPFGCNHIAKYNIFPDFFVGVHCDKCNKLALIYRKSTI